MSYIIIHLAGRKRFDRRKKGWLGNQFHSYSRQQVICTLIYDMKGNTQLRNCECKALVPESSVFPTAVCDLLVIGHTNNLVSPAEHLKNETEQTE